MTEYMHSLFIFGKRKRLGNGLKYERTCATGRMSNIGNHMKKLRLY